MVDSTIDAERARRSGFWRSPGAASLAVAVGTLALILCLGPLPFGSVLVRERTLLQVAAFVACGGALLWRSRSLRVPGEASAVSLVPALAIALIGVWGMVQSLPLPAGWVRLASPGVAAVWEGAAKQLGEPLAPRLSLSPAVSWQTGIQWLAVAACMAAATLVSRRRSVRRVLAVALAAVALFEVVFGAEKWMARSSMMWGMAVAGDASRLRGTFINSNHFAFFLQLALAVTLAALWWSARRLARRGPIEQRVLGVFLPGLLFLIFFAGIAFSGSRAGLVASGLAILVFAVLLAVHYRRFKIGLLASGAALLGVAGVALFGWRQGLERWAATSAYDVTWSARWDVYRATFDLWRSSPWTGTGLGTFRQAFPAVQPETVGGLWIHAHSDVLEIVATAGLVAVPVLLPGLAVLWRRLLLVFATGHRSEDRAAGLAALVALSGALAHSLVDFALTIPANAFTLAVICGLALGVPAPPLRQCP